MTVYIYYIPHAYICIHICIYMYKLDVVMVCLRSRARTPSKLLLTACLQHDPVCPYCTLEPGTRQGPLLSAPQLKTWQQLAP